MVGLFLVIKEYTFSRLTRYAPVFLPIMESISLYVVLPDAINWSIEK